MIEPIQATDLKTEITDLKIQFTDLKIQLTDLKKEIIDLKTQFTDPNTQPSDRIVYQFDFNAQPFDPNALPSEPKKLIINKKSYTQTIIQTKRVNICNKMINGSLFFKINYLNNQYLVHIDNINNLRFNYINNLNDEEKFIFEDQYSQYSQYNQNANSSDLRNLHLTKKMSNISNISAISNIQAEFTNDIAEISDENINNILLILNASLKIYFKSNFNIENFSPKTKNNLFIMKLENNTEYVISDNSNNLNTINTQLVNSEQISIIPIQLYKIKQYPDYFAKLCYLSID